MAAITYYWVGGAGTWDNTSATNWAASSGGAGGAGVPDYLDYVIFDSASNSATYQVTIGTTAAARDVTAAGPLTGTLTFAFGTTGAILMFGQWQNNATGVAFTGSGSINWITSISCGIDTNGVSLASVAITFYDIFLAAADLTLLSNLTTTGSVTIDSGAFNTNGKTLSCNTLNSTGGLTRTINLGTSAITFTGTATVVNFLAATNLTFNAGTSTITCSGTNAALRASGQTFYIVNFTSLAQGITTIQGSNTFFNITQSSRSAAGQRQIIVDGYNTITGTLTLQTLGTPDATKRVFVQSDVIGTMRTLNAAALAGMSDVDFRDIGGAGAASWTGIRIGDCLGNSGITFTTGVNKYWGLATGGNWNSTAWSTAPVLTITASCSLMVLTTTGTPALVVGMTVFSSTGVSLGTITGGSGSTWAVSIGGTYTSQTMKAVTLDANNFPLAQDTVNIELKDIVSASTITFNVTYQIPTIVCTRTLGSNTLTIACTVTESMYGNWTLCNGLTFIGTATWSFVGQGLTQTITSNSIPFSQSFTVNSFNGTVSLADAFTTGSTSTLTLTSGTLDLNSLTLTTGIYSGSGTLARSLLSYGVPITITGSSTLGNTLNVVSVGTSTNFTVDVRPTFNLTSSPVATAGTRNVTFGGTNTTTYPNINVTNGSDTVTSSGTSTFNNFTFQAGFTGTFGNAIRNIYGNLTMHSGMATPSSGALLTSFIGVGSQTITTGGLTLDFPITFNEVGGVWAMQDALTLGSTRALTMINGTLQLKSGTTNTVGSFTTSGTNQKFLQATIPGSQATISDASGTNSVSYLTIKDIAATGGAIFQAYTTNSNINSGNNTGWDFIFQVGRTIYTRRKNKRYLY